jgi:hypothetical protein
MIQQKGSSFMEQSGKKFVIDTTKKPGTDYTLMVRRLEKALLENPENPKARDLLVKKNVWQKLPPSQALEWGALAQIAGLPDTALDIYAGMTDQEPKNADAWEAFIRLLDILDLRSRLAGAVAMAQKHLPPEQVNAWVSRQTNQQQGLQDYENNLEATTDPFARMHARQARLERFMDLFAGRQDVFARQWADKDQEKSGYVPVRRPMDKSDLEDHLKGVKTYGIYLMEQNATVRCGIIDADLVPSLRGKNRKTSDSARIKKEQAYMIARLDESSRAIGLAPLVEISGGKGFHFWYFSDKPVQASMMRKAMAGLADPLKNDLSCFDLEIFPKQDHLTGKGFGNLVKLPLGIHRLSGKRSFFPGCPKSDTDSQLAFLEQVKTAAPGVFTSGPEKAEPQKVVMHPNMETLTQEYPGLFELQRNCPPLGQIIALVREGRGLRVREEKILFQTLGFLPDAKKILHYLFRHDPEYNPHMVNYKLSRLRGTPLGCRRIHSLTGIVRDFCDIAPDSTGYIHPLLLVEVWQKMAEKKTPVSKKILNLEQAIDNLKIAISQVERFMA